jgi:hypothetical protein
MPIRSNSVTPSTIREIMPPCRLSANLPQAILAVPKARLREHVNASDQRTAVPAQNPESTFSRIYPVNPETPTAPSQNRNSTFSRIYPMNPETPVATAQNPNSTFPRIYPMNPEPMRLRQPSNPHFFATQPCGH